MKHSLRNDGLDADTILQGLPTWRRNYRSVRLGYNGQLPQITDSVALTVHGLMNTSTSSTSSISALVKAFLVAIQIAAVRQRNAQPMPTEVVKVIEPGEPFTRAVNMQAGTGLSPDQLFDLLRGEPPTLRGCVRIGDSWTWDLTEAELDPLAGVRTADDYLSALDSLVSLPQVPSTRVPLSPMALPEAFDHLDLAWRLVHKDHLFRVPRVSIGAKLTQPVSSIEEFESRCSALADLLNSFAFTLNDMKSQLSGLLGEQSGRACDAVDVLRQVVALRAGQQHTGADVRSERARTGLGLDRFTGNWPDAWDHLRAVTVQALGTIREEITTLLD